MRPAARNVVVAFALGLCSIAAWSQVRVIPAEFRNDRVFLVARSNGQPVLTFFTDTGGGWNAISSSAASRLGLGTIGSIENEEGNGPPRYSLVAFPAVVMDAGLPPPKIDRSMKGGLVVVEDLQSFGDGFLGSGWFADRVWEIDYVAKSFKLLSGIDLRDASHRVPLGFHHGADGKRDLDFPRVSVTIDGEAIDMLLDTGASAKLTATSAARFNLPIATEIGTGFIVKSIFDKWVAKHPDWSVIPAADGTSNAPMIEVPTVTIAGLAAGPVWFTQRRDKDLHDFMSPMMDKTIEGALGGSALKYFRMTLDYPAAVAYFELPGSGSGATPAR
jgi:hypothetical protein